jgi:phosphoserine phosphatase RsbX
MDVMAGVIDWGVAARALPGQLESGDLHVVEPVPGGALVAVIDALGHGPEAAEAARVARATLLANPAEPVTVLVERCHAQLRSTRGAVMSVASIDADRGTLTWLGIGNVDGYVIRAAPIAERQREALVHRGGVVGFSLPRTRPTTIALAHDDLLLLATDGISHGFIDGNHRGDVQTIADGILVRFAKVSDDALILVARYVGTPR